MPQPDPDVIPLRPLLQYHPDSAVFLKLRLAMAIYRDDMPTIIRLAAQLNHVLNGVVIDEDER